MGTKQSLSATNAPGVHDRGAQVYSDANAPGSFEMTVAGEPATPPSGETVLWSADGKSLLMKAADGTVTTVGPSAGGGGSSGPYLSATGEDPTVPVPTTGINLFTRNRARRHLAWQGPSGHDTRVQSFMGGNRVGLTQAVAATATLSYLAMPAITAYTTNTALTPGTPGSGVDPFIAMQRTRFPGGSTTAATTAGFRQMSYAYRGGTETSALGGFHWVLRCNPFSVGVPARGVFGLFAANAALAATTTSTLNHTNWVGFGWEGTGTQITVLTGSATGRYSQALTGSTFTVGTGATDMFEFALFCPPGPNKPIYWSVTKVSSTFTQSGVIPAGTAGLPAASTFLTTQALVASTAAATIGYDFQSLYIESDN